MIWALFYAVVPAIASTHCHDSFNVTEHRNNYKINLNKENSKYPVKRATIFSFVYDTQKNDRRSKREAEKERESQHIKAVSFSFAILLCVNSFFSLLSCFFLASSLFLGECFSHIVDVVEQNRSSWPVVFLLGVFVPFCTSAHEQRCFMVDVSAKINGKATIQEEHNDERSWRKIAVYVLKWVW